MTPVLYARQTRVIDVMRRLHARGEKLAFGRFGFRAVRKPINNTPPPRAA